MHRSSTNGTAAVPWQPKDQPPTDPKQLILLQVKDKRDVIVRYLLVHRVRDRWVFPDSSHVSDLQVPLCWSVLNDG
jgi:hypothetical protein